MIVTCSLGVVDSNTVHHLCVTYASWCLYYDYYACVYGYIHLKYWTPIAHITCTPCMHPDVGCSLNRVCMRSVHLGLWTQAVCITCEPYMHHDVYFSLNIMLVCGYIHLWFWTQTVCITYEPCMHPDVYCVLSIMWCVLVEYTLNLWTRQCASLANFACILMSVVFWSIMHACVCRYIHLVL